RRVFGLLSMLLVKYDNIIRKLILMYLEKNVYTVVEAVDGEQAKELFLLHHPCLIILDLMLPKVSGEQFCQWVKAKEKDVAIIMLSAKARVDQKIAGLKMGADQ